VDVNFGFPPAQHVGKIQQLFFDCTQVVGKLLMLCVTDVVSVVEIREEFVDIVREDLARGLGNNRGQLTMDRRDLGFWSCD
jgi:hypothetical protein